MPRSVKDIREKRRRVCYRAQILMDAAVCQNILDRRKKNRAPQNIAVPLPLLRIFIILKVWRYSK